MHTSVPHLVCACVRAHPSLLVVVVVVVLVVVVGVNTASRGIGMMPR